MTGQEKAELSYSQIQNSWTRNHHCLCVVLVARVRVALEDDEEDVRAMVGEDEVDE